MTERTIRLHGDRAPVSIQHVEGVPTSAQADAARVLLAGHAKPPEGSRVLDLWCGTGLCAIAAGRAEPSARVVASDVNYRFCALASSQAQSNDVSNVTVEHSDGFDHLSAGAWDEIYFYPPAHCSATTVKKLIAQALVRLRVEGRLWLATRKGRGGQTYQRWADSLFDGGTRVARHRGCEVCFYRRGRSDVGVAEERARELAKQEQHWFETTVRGMKLQFQTKVNVFSWQGLDRGTELLLEALPGVRPARILDLGCGYGPIGVVAARLYQGAEVTLCDVDRRALELARINVDLNGCVGTEVRVSDGVGNLGSSRYDLIVSNLPTHVGKQQMLALLSGAHQRLSPGGRFLAVISRELSVDRAARDIFGNALTVAECNSHRVFQCERDD